MVAALPDMAAACHESVPEQLSLSAWQQHVIIIIIIIAYATCSERAPQ